MNQYETEQDHQLFFWKEEEDIIGLIGVLFLDNHQIQIQHISVNPSHRGKGVGKRMVMALKELHKDTHLIPNENTRQVEEYDNTTFHEFTHSAGHQNRL